MLPHDYDLTLTEIQQLANAEAVAALFAALGYNTDARLKQTPQALGFPDGLAREVLSMERIADQEQGELQVYLVELKRVTVAIMQSLARIFKNRAGLFLLILTTNYEQLDFVLLEPETLEAKEKIQPAGGSQVALRPRTLTVDRRNPATIALRVLRRFSYTEIDPLYQWDKLRSAYSVAEWSEPLFNNRALFSDYYLSERLPQRQEWKEDPHPVYRPVSSLLADVRQRFSGQPEKKIRQELLEPVFHTLGWTIERGKSAQDDSLQPDYWLIPLQSAGMGKDKEHPSGVRAGIPCLAYTWDRSLDGMDEQRDADTPGENPAQSVVSILESLDADQAGWAVVTNGKFWRLYSARAHSRATNYYEVDLEETLASPDVNEAFRYFWLFFRAKAFEFTSTLTPGPSPTRRGESFVDALLTESASFAKALGERLKENVFENVFPRLAEGFIKNWGKPAVELSDDDKR